MPLVRNKDGSIRLKGDKKPIKRFEDDFGNVIIRKGNVLYLRLRGTTRRRRIGIISGGILIARRKKAIHLHRKSDSYGFNHYILANAQSFDTVKLMDDTDTYLIPNKKIIELGHYLHFLEKGFERQVFVKLEDLQQFKLKNEL